MVSFFQLTNYNMTRRRDFNRRNACQFVTCMKISNESGENNRELFCFRPILQVRGRALHPYPTHLPR